MICSNLLIFVKKRLLPLLTKRVLETDLVNAVLSVQKPRYIVIAVPI